MSIKKAFVIVRSVILQCPHCKALQPNGSSLGWTFTALMTLPFVVQCEACKGEYVLDINQWRFDGEPEARSDDAAYNRETVERLSNRLVRRLPHSARRSESGKLHRGRKRST